jgi:hypothetical protein
MQIFKNSLLESGFCFYTKVGFVNMFKTNVPLFIAFISFFKYPSLTELRQAYFQKNVQPYGS